MKKIKFALFVGLLCASGAWSQGVVPSGNSFSRNEQGFRTWFFEGGYKVGSGPMAGPAGTPMVNAPYNPQNLSGWTPAGNYGVSPAATGPTVNTSANWPTPNGKSMDIKVAAPIVATAVGKLLVIGLNGLAIFQAGQVIWDAAKELGYTTSKNPDGTVGYSKPDPTVCSVAPCYKFVEPGAFGGKITPQYPSLTAAAQAMVGKVPNDSYGASPVGVGACSGANNPGYANCDLMFPNSTGTYPRNYYFGHVSVSASPASNIATTEKDFIDSVAARSGWPVSANLAKAIAQTVANPPAGQPAPSVDLGPATVTGPASSPGNTTTTNNPDTTKTVSTNTYNYTYAGDKISTTVNNTTTTYNADNSVKSTTTTTAPADKPSNPCNDNPDTLGCSKFGDAPTAEKIPTKEINVAVTSVSFAAPGGCPAPLQYAMFGKTYAISYDPFCDLMGKLYPLFMALGAAAAAWIFMEGLKP